MNCVYNGFEAFLNHVFSPVQGVRQKSTRPHFIERVANKTRTYFMCCFCLLCILWQLLSRNKAFNISTPAFLHSCSGCCLSIWQPSVLGCNVIMMIMAIVIMQDNNRDQQYQLTPTSCRILAILMVAVSPIANYPVPGVFIRETNILLSTITQRPGHRSTFGY